jgi:hypothetical protein
MGALDFASQNDTSLSVTIALNGTQSSNVFIGGASLIGLTMPAAWTAADLAVYGSTDGVTFGPVTEKDGTAVKFTSPAAGGLPGMIPTDCAHVNWIQLRSSAKQLAARVIGLIVRPL